MNKYKGFYEICKHSCRFYKPERKTDEHCYGFEQVIDLILHNRIKVQTVLSLDISKFKNLNDSLLMEKLCKKCPFLKDGCDFRAGKGNEACGGYKILDILIERGMLARDFKTG